MGGKERCELMVEAPRLLVTFRPGVPHFPSSLCLRLCLFHTERATTYHFIGTISQSSQTHTCMSEVQVALQANESPFIVNREKNKLERVRHCKAAYRVKEFGQVLVNLPVRKEKKRKANCFESGRKRKR